MSSVYGGDGETYSELKDNPHVPYIDYEDDRSVVDYDIHGEDTPVVISAPFPLIDGKIPKPIVVGETVFEEITVKNTTDEPVDLWGVKIYCSNPKDSFTLSITKPPPRGSDEDTLAAFFETMCLEDRVLQEKQTFKLYLCCKPKDIGVHMCIVHFDVGDDRIERVVFLLAEDHVSQMLFTNRPYSRRGRAPRGRGRFSTEKFIPGSRPVRSTPGYLFRLPFFPIQDSVRELAAEKKLPEILNDELCSANYMGYFTALLNLEELQIEENMREHDMQCVALGRGGPQLLTLEVPGLAERRPSLVCGDYVFAKIISDADEPDKPYQGYIHKVEAEKVFLKFAKEFHQSHHDQNLYSVGFMYNRLNMRRQYQAIEFSRQLSSSVLFPSSSSRRRLKRANEYELVNKDLNEEQLAAVDMILRCRGSPPYIVHGPPGTGKTMTLVEAALQVYNSMKNSHILICASSNCASDHILMKLTPNVKETDIFRLNASSRALDDTPSDIFPYCFFDESNFLCPPLTVFLKYKIIVCTYMSASLLFVNGVKRGHFSHVLLDEAGQASEPETMIPIASLSNEETVVVLAGDPLQLGPVVMSQEAGEHGLGKSFLERLSEFDIYDGRDRSYVIKLVRNYRCHPAILKLPSELFYNGELLASKLEKDSLCISDWSGLVNKTFPVLFYGVQGCDEREGNNPSWFNRTEASKVVKIVQELKNDIDVLDKDIGVITPYRQQVLKLKKALEVLNLSDVQVGSVEQFQGQEKEIIIISTVRSTIRYDNFDKIHHLGFLSNSKRFNVAVTRARSLLIIVGNPHIICKDFYWDKLLQHCVENESYQGCPLPEQEKVEVYPAAEHEFSGGNEACEVPTYEGQPHACDDGWNQNFDSYEKKVHTDQGAPHASEDGWNQNFDAYEKKVHTYEAAPHASEDGWNQNFDACEKKVHAYQGDSSDCEDGWNQTFDSYELPKPVTDEAEWSDGWK